MNKVTGIGGIFFKCDDPEKVKDWYKENLGFDTTPYGTTFDWLHSNNPKKKGTTHWSPFAKDTKYFEPSEKGFMINFRVDNLIELIEELKKNDVVILDEIEDCEYGKFIHVLDNEGNKIELWEPPKNE